MTDRCGLIVFFYMIFFKGKASTSGNRDRCPAGSSLMGAGAALIRKSFALLLLGVLLVAAAARAGAGEIGQRRTNIEKFWEREFTVGTLRGSGGVELRYAGRKAAAGRGALVVVSGRTEYAEKYAELFYDLKDSGLSLYTYDHRGQGLSGRLLADRGKGHVADFDDYVADLDLFLARIVRPQKPKAIIVLSHSMGGTISLLYAARHRGVLDGIILCSPMLSLDLHHVLTTIVRGVCRLAVHAGLGDAAVPGAAIYERQKVFEGNSFTGSRQRFEVNRRLIARNPLLAIEAPTFGWVDQALAATRELMEQDPDPGLPILLLQGENDRVVGGEEQRQLCRRLDDCRLVALPEGRHELLMEKDAIRDRVLAEIHGFIDETTR